MAVDELRFWLIMSTTSLFWVVVFVAVAWKRGFRSTPPAKRLPSPQPTENSANPSDLARVMADQAELFSTLGKLTTTVKRLSSRQGMEEIRERRSTASATPDPPPPGTSKAELLRYYGMAGKAGPAFAQAQLDLEKERQH